MRQQLGEAGARWREPAGLACRQGVKPWTQGWARTRHTGQGATSRPWCCCSRRRELCQCRVRQVPQNMWPHSTSAWWEENKGGRQVTDAEACGPRAHA